MADPSLAGDSLSGDTMSVWLMFLLSVVVLQVSVLCTTIYLHRALTHRGLDVHPVLAFLMHLHINLFTGISPRQWVAVHRKHHHFSDKEGDPHSPYLLGLWHVFFGNALYYRNEANNTATVRKYTPDYKGTLIDRLPLLHGWGILGGLALFLLAFGWAWGLAWFLFHAVAYIFLNASINSLCHMVGYRNYDNLATNLRSVAWLTGGEGLHNNHHEFPSAAQFSMKRGEFDPAWPVIRLLEVIGLAKVKRIQIAKAA
jgi:stearoyl-CoA desaturase (delta-9 desaturase)